MAPVPQKRKELSSVRPGGSEAAVSCSRVRKTTLKAENEQWGWFSRSGTWGRYSESRHVSCAMVKLYPSWVGDRGHKAVGAIHLNKGDSCKCRLGMGNPGNVDLKLSFPDCLFLPLTFLSLSVRFLPFTPRYLLLFPSCLCLLHEQRQVMFPEHGDLQASGQYVWHGEPEQNPFHHACGSQHIHQPDHDLQQPAEHCPQPGEWGAKGKAGKADSEHQELCFPPKPSQGIRFF